MSAPVHPAGYMTTITVSAEGAEWSFHLDDLGVIRPRMIGAYRLTLVGSADGSDSFGFRVTGSATRDEVIAKARRRARAWLYDDEWDEIS